MGTVTLPSYPAELENWWLEQTEGDIDSYERDVATLSDLFTLDRPQLAGTAYFDNPRHLVAYGLFFFPQTFQRTALVLSELAGRHARPAATGGQPVNILDLGAGTGAAGLCAARRTAPCRLTLVDSSPPALRAATNLFEACRNELWPGATLLTRIGDLGSSSVLDGGPWDLVLASFALNEAFAGRPDAAEAWFDRAVSALAPRGVVLIIEPAGEASGPLLERLRTRAIRDGRVRILAPCLHESACPLRSRPGDWCHDVRTWTPPASLTWLNRRLFRPVDTLKFGFLAVGPNPAPAAWHGHRSCRLVSPLLQRRGLVTARGCAADGGLHGYEQLLRGLSRPDRDRLDSVQRGDVIDAPEVRPLGDGFTLRLPSFLDRAFGFDPACQKA